MGMTDKAESAFEIYRDMGPTRTLKGAAELMGKHVGQLNRWSARYQWARLCEEHDHGDLKEKLSQRETVRETALQTILDRMQIAIDKVFDVLTDDSKLPVLDRQGEHLTGPDGEPLYRPVVKPSTQLMAAQLVLGIGGLVAVKRTETINRTGEDLDRAAGIMSTMTPEQLKRLVADLQSSEPEGSNGGN